MVLRSLIIVLALFSLGLASDLSLYLSNAKRAEALKKFSEAIDWYRKALESSKDKDLRMKIYFRMAYCYSKLDNSIAAFSLYQEGLRNPKAEEYLISHPRLFITLANLYFDFKKYKEAANIYLKVLEKYKNRPFIPFVLVKAGDSLFNLKKYRRALKLYSKVILLYEGTDEYWISRFRMADIGVFYPGIKIPESIEYEDYRNPVKAYKEIIENAPETLSKLKQLAHLRISSFYMKKGRYDLAIEGIKKFLEGYPSSILKRYAKKLLNRAVSEYVDVLYEKKDYLKVCKLYDSLKDEIIISELKYETAKKIGDSLYRFGLYRDALKFFIQNPKQNLLRIAEIYNRLGRYRETISLLKSSKPSQKLALILAEAYFKEKRYEDVIKVLKNIKDPKAYYLLAEAYDKLQRYTKAINYYEILTEIESEYRLNACLYLANFYFDRKRYQKALSYYLLAQKICKGCPDFDFIKLQIANCYYEMGRYKESSEILKQVKDDKLIGLVSNLQLEIMKLENEYRDLKWLIE